MIALLLAAPSWSATPWLQLPSDVHAVRESVELAIDPSSTVFSGKAVIALHLDRPVTRLWLDAKQLAITQASITGDGPPAPVTVRAGNEEVMAFSWSGARSGEVTLAVEYTGLVSDVETQGVFRQREGDDWYVFSEFEAPDARRAFPCVDEPAAKIPWTLAVRVPDGNRAYSNMPLVDSAGGTYRFAESPPLSSYLVAFAVGPFDEVDAGTAGRAHVPVRILVPRGTADRAADAATSTAQLLDVEEKWFDRPFPYPKLDVLVIPQTVAFGGMENAGLITAAADPALTPISGETPAHERDWAYTIAHELAHMWFGDLVTNAWWDDLWLNEAFATWMEAEIVGIWRPDWDVEVDRADYRSGGMAQDALASARAIRQPIGSYDDIENAFDDITYFKGSAVVDMFARYAGEDAFRAAVRRYLDAHAGATATADDLIGELGRDDPAIAAAFHSFIDQSGVPLVDLALDCSGATPVIHLHERHWIPSGSTGDPRGSWQVPVGLRWEGGGTRVLLGPDGADVPVDGACPAWILGNDGDHGYYRVAYGGRLLATLLSGDVPLTVPETLGVIGDASALVASGEVQPGDVLGALPGLVEKGDPRVLGATVGVVAALQGNLVPDALRPNFQRFVRQTYGPPAHDLGLVPREGEAIERRLLRPELLGLVSEAGDDEELGVAAGDLATAWLADHRAVDSDLAPLVLSIAARRGDAALFDRFLAAARAEKDRDSRQNLLSALGRFRDPALVDRALALATTDEFDIRELSGLLQGPFVDPATREQAWGFVEQHVDEIAARIPGIARAYVIWTGGAFCDEDHARQVEALFAHRAKKWLGGPRILEETLEEVRVCAAGREAQEPGIQAFLSGY